MTASNRVKVNHAERKLHLEKKAKAFGLEVKNVVGSTYVFTRWDGVTESVFGLWAAELFMRGIAFEQRVVPEKHQEGQWR